MEFGCTDDEICSQATSYALLVVRPQRDPK